METKPWYQSKTMWAGVITLISGLLRTFGIADLTGDQAALLEKVLEIVTIISGLLTLYGRARARGPIHPPGSARIYLCLTLCLLLSVCGCNRGSVKISAVIEGQPAPHAGWNFGPDSYVAAGDTVRVSGLLFWLEGTEPNDISGR
jgi:hypothetical protein